MSENPQSIITLAFRNDEKAAWVELLDSKPYVQDTEENKSAVKATQKFINDGLGRIQVKDLTAYDSAKYWQQVIIGHQEIVKSLREYLAKELASFVPDGHVLTLNELNIYREYMNDGFYVVQDFEVGTRQVIA